MTPRLTDADIRDLWAMLDACPLLPTCPHMAEVTLVEDIDEWERQQRLDALKRDAHFFCEKA